MDNKHNYIYYLEGPDGSGKTTLANKIAEIKKASNIHSSFNKDWDIKKYHDNMMEAVQLILPYTSVILDRWAISEKIYGEIFRGKPSYNVIDYLWENEDKLNNAIFIYCRNNDVIRNHVENQKVRFEMYNDMSKVIKSYDEFIDDNPLQYNWIIYDYTENDMEEFVKQLPGKNYN